MADEATKKTPADEKESGGFGDILSGIGKGLIDGLAESSPIAGKMLQYGVNAAGIETPDYAAKETKRKQAKQDLIASVNRNKEYEANAPLREKQRRAEEMKADEFAARALDRETAADRERMEDEEYLADAPVRQMAKDEYVQNAPLREANRNSGIAKARLSEAKADAEYKQLKCSEIQDKMKKDISRTPGMGIFSYPEINEIFLSPQLQKMVDGLHYEQEIDGIAKNDKAAFARMDRELRRQGWSLIDGEDGLKYLDMGNGKQVAVTKRNMDALKKQAYSAVAEEIKTRSIIADDAVKGNPAKRSIAVRTKALMPYNNNNATASFKMVQDVFNNASEEEQGWNMFHQAFSDWNSSSVSTDGKGAELLSCIPFLGKMGFEKEGFDPKKPDPNVMQFIDKQTGKKYNFMEFGKLCEENDTLGGKLDERIGLARKTAIARDRQIFAQEVEETKLALQDQKANAPKKTGGKGDWFGKGGEDSGDEAKENEAMVSGLSRAFGEKFDNLDDNKRKKIVSVFKHSNTTMSKLCHEYGKKSIGELPDKALKEIQDTWNEDCKREGIDPTQFYSPVDNLIRQRSIKSMQEETAEKERAAEETRQFNEEWDNNYHGDEDSGAAFRRNYRQWQEDADRDRTKKRNDEAIREHQEVLKRRGK